MNAKQEYDSNKEEINEIEEKIEALKKESKTLLEANQTLLQNNCMYRDNEKRICTYDNTPLNRDGWYCSDCISAGYCHPKIKIFEVEN